MARTSKEFNVAEFSGGKFSNLRGAQACAAGELAQGLAGTMRGLLARGLLMVVDGKIIVNPENKA
jgi:hypothetical protein